MGGSAAYASYTAQYLRLSQQGHGLHFKAAAFFLQVETAPHVGAAENRAVARRQQDGAVTQYGAADQRLAALLRQLQPMHAPIGATQPPAAKAVGHQRARRRFQYAIQLALVAGI